MVIKGGSRKGPGRLATHLLRADTNERVDIIELDSAHTDIKEAFRDWQVLTEGTRGELGLYHAQINPEARYAMTPEQWRRTVAVLESELGFEGQPRAVVMHEKHGRQHIHVVWARTDIDTMKLRPDGKNYEAHERASLKLEQEFGHDLTPGKHAKRDREKQPELPKAEITHGEWQQAERTGIDPRDRKDQLTGLYERSDNGQALKAAVEEHGYVLAQGDRRDFVLVDEFGEVHNLARQIRGVKAKELRDFMQDTDSANLPTVEQAKELQRQKEREQEDKKREEEGRADKAREDQKAVTPAAEPPTDEDLSQREIRQLEKALTHRQAGEAEALRNTQKYDIRYLRAHFKEEIQEKMANLRAMQEAERDRWQREEKERRSGVWGVIDAIQRRLNPVAAAEKAKARREEFENMKKRQRQERADELVLLKQTRDQEIEALKERHELARRKHGEEYDKQLDRYLREHEAARRLLLEVEERRREKAIEQERSRLRLGPELPPPRRAR